MLRAPGLWIAALNFDDTLNVYPTMKRLPVLMTLALVTTAPGCIYVKTHSTIEPIKISVDVNLKVQLEKELADAFGDIDAASTTVGAPAAPAKTAPAPAP